MVGLGPLRTTTDFNVHEMTPFYRRVWGIRIGVEVQFRSTSSCSASRIPTSSTFSSTTTSISSTCAAPCYVQRLVMWPPFNMQLIITKAYSVPSNNLMNHGGHVITACTCRYVRVIKIIHLVLPVESRAHQQGPYRYLSRGLFQMLNYGVIFWLHSPQEFLRFSFSYWPLSLILLLSSESKIVRSVTPSRPHHSWSSNSFNNNLRLDESFWCHKGNNLWRFQNNKLSLLFDS